jgi:hypothetical protein
MTSPLLPGRVLVLGCGGVAQCTVPLLIRDTPVDPRSVTVVDFVDNRHRIADSLARGVNWESGRVTEENLDEFLSARLGPGDLLLDAGAGFGRHAYAAARLGARVVAVDYAPEEVATTRATFAAMLDSGEIAPESYVGACRGDAKTPTPFHFGATLDASWARYDASYTYGRGRNGAKFKQPWTTGSSGLVNRWGLAELHGQLLEWCAQS